MYWAGAGSYYIALSPSPPLSTYQSMLEVRINFPVKVSVTHIDMFFNKFRCTNLLRIAITLSFS